MTWPAAVADVLWPIRPERGAGWQERTTAVIAAAALLMAAGPVLMSIPDDVATRAGRAATDVRETVAPAETIVAGYGGVTFTHSSDVHFSKPGATDLTAHAVDWIGRPFKSPIYYGLRAIRWPGAGRLGGMVDFTHAKAISVREQQVRFSGTRNGRPADGSARIGDTFRHLEFSHGHNMLTLNGLLRLARLAPRLQPYVGGGLGLSLPHTEVQFLDETRRTYEYQVTGGVGQVLAGVEIRLARVSLFVEYKFSLAPYYAPLSGGDGTRGNAFTDYYSQLRRWWSGEAPAFGLLTTRLATHHLIVGVGARFSGAAPGAPAE